MKFEYDILMMTPKQAVDKYGNTPTLDKEHAMAEIQRDAREGMVPLNDIKPLVEAVIIANYETGEKWQALEKLKAKHPKLFEK